MTYLLRGLVLAGCLIAGAASAQTTMSTAEARLLAEQALAADKPAVTIAIAQTLLKRDPDDYSLLVILSLAQTRLENHDAATAASSRAYRVAENDAQKLQSSRMAGAGHFKSGQHVRAEWWLRRAANHTATAQDSALVKQEFAIIRQKNPFSAQLSFSATPSSNVNNGSNESVFTIGDLEFLLSADSLALSGIEYSGSARLGYRLSESKDQITSVGFLVYGRTYSLSAASKDSVPGASGRDFSLVATEISLSHRRQVFAGLGATGISAHIGQNWYGGEPLWRYGRISLSQDFPIGQRSLVTLRGFVEKDIGLDGLQPDTLIYDLDASFAHRLGNRDIVRLSLGAKAADAVIDTSDYTSLRANLHYSFDNLILGTRLSLNLGLWKKDYDIFALTIDGRHDKSASIGATAVFENLSYFGFSPSLTVQASRTSSNASRYSTDQLTASMGIQSNF